MALRPSKQLEDPKSGSLHEVSQFTGGCKQGANFVLLMVFLKVYSFLPAWSIIKHCSTGVCHEKSKNVVDMGPFQRTSEHFINHLDTFLSILWNWFFSNIPVWSAFLTACLFFQFFPRLFSAHRCCSLTTVAGGGPEGQAYPSVSWSPDMNPGRKQTQRCVIPQFQGIFRSNCTSCYLSNWATASNRAARKSVDNKPATPITLVHVIS